MNFVEALKYLQTPGNRVTSPDFRFGEYIQIKDGILSHNMLNTGISPVESYLLIYLSKLENFVEYKGENLAKIYKAKSIEEKGKQWMKSISKSVDELEDEHSKRRDQNWF